MSLLRNGEGGSEMRKSRVVLRGGMCSIAAILVAAAGYAQHSNSFTPAQGMTARALGAITVGSGWQVFGWAASPKPSPVTQNPFTFTLTDPGYVALTDFLVDGDQFRVFDGTTLLGDTSVPLDDGKFQVNFNLAWADPAFSKRVFLLAPGPHSINVFVIRSASCSGCDTGNALIRVGLKNDGFYSSPIPALGLVGLAGLAILVVVAGFLALRRG